MNRRLFASLLALAALLFLSGTVPAPAAGGDEALLAQGLETRLKAQSIRSAEALHWSELSAFYSARDYRPVWIDSDGPLPRAAQLRAVLLRARQEGLDPEAYFPDEIAQDWKLRSPSTLIRLELLLSEAFLRYSVDVSIGDLPPRMLDPNWHIAAPKADPVALLQHCLAARDFSAALDALPPPHAGYRRLRAALARYRRLAAAGGWPTLPPGPALRRGQTGRAVAILRTRLAAQEDMPLTDTARTRHFDQALEFAVERFQVRHGLRMDGVVGPATRAAMNVPVAERISQIELNMQRWRWLPRRLGRRYIMVNAAGFELTAFADRRPRLSMRAVVGKPERRTPVISGRLHTIVVNPTWTVPPTITFEDFVPAQIRNPAFLRSHHIQVLSNRLNGGPINPATIDWKAVDPDHFPYILRQAPGPTNPLGRIKFLFSNPYDIYLHDTPRRWLFGRRQRAFSSGCIRIEQPLRLAQWVMNGKGEWTQRAFKAAIASGDTKTLSPPRAIPVYVVYWTAWVGEHGGLYFHDDVYDSDCALTDCPAGGRPVPPGRGAKARPAGDPGRSARGGANL
ncbi:MAG: L,D-transpeptidase family protein [Gammaproteobacteria bacterium]